MTPVSRVRRRLASREPAPPRLSAAPALAAFAARPACQTADDAVTTATRRLPRCAIPIALVNAPTDLDVFVGRNDGRLDERQAQDLQPLRRATTGATAAGPMQMLVPTARPAGASYGGERVVRAALAEHGVGARDVQVSLYRSRRRRDRRAGPADLRQAAGQGDDQVRRSGPRTSAAPPPRSRAGRTSPTTISAAPTRRDRRPGRRPARPRRGRAAETRADVDAPHEGVRRRAQGDRSLTHWKTGRGQRQRRQRRRKLSDAGVSVPHGSRRAPRSRRVAHRAGAAHRRSRPSARRRTSPRSSRPPAPTGAWTRPM